jgi:hypothetical protein
MKRNLLDVITLTFGEKSGASNVKSSPKATPEDKSEAESVVKEKIV